MGGREAAEHHLYRYLQDCYKAIEGSKVKNSVSDRSSPTDVFYKNVFLKISQYTQKNICARVSFK